MSVIYKKERMNLSTLSHDQMFFSVTETTRFGQDIWWLPLAGGWDLSQSRQKPSDSCWNYRTDPRYIFFPPETPISLVPNRTGRNNNQFIAIFELLATFGTNQTSSQSPPAQALS